ncbi:site-specific integrase [Erythrobacter sanguineus]|uniref:Site-specific recombinase XerD n=1 Tax=Erythrobacter sanguineus TaxID=198312 RepID=A0A1M7RY01_9SPHN|nr:site-specific integrase [Erythrobacter sanguineus]SHN51024.1 Site-specific recombinase XerD [Erythrobacter sanguineus]
MQQPKRPAGRPRRFSEFDRFEAELPNVMAKRPKYLHGIGLFKGATGCTVWLKIRLPHGGSYNGRMVPAGGSVEIKKGKRSSWTWQELIQERDRLQRLADHGEPLEAVQMPSFATYAAEWLDRKKTMLKSFGVTQGNVNRSLIPAFGKMALDAIAVGDVNRWIGNQRATLKPATVQRELNTFNAIMNDAVKNGLIDRNPATLADKPKGAEARQRFITAEEYNVILATCDRIEWEQEERREQTPHRIRGWLRHFIAWAYNSGMRRAEILALRWENIREVDQDHTVVEVLNTKSNKSRFVSCTPEMKAILAALRELPRDPEDDRLFPLSMATLKRNLRALWKATGLKDVRLHDLRRSHATILMSNGIDPRTIAGRLGHSGTAMLAKHYAVDRGDKEAAARFAEATEVRLS